MVATTNGALKTQLETWTTALEAARSMEVASKGRGEAITAFCRTFVPPDVGEDEILAFSGQLGEDEEFFNSFCREIKQCASGDRVEKITGDQNTKAVFTLLPAADSGIEIDIVREVAFICQGSEGRLEAVA